jgi:hypothetical protein
MESNTLRNSRLAFVLVLGIGSVLGLALRIAASSVGPAHEFTLFTLVGFILTVCVVIGTSVTIFGWLLRRLSAIGRLNRASALAVFLASSFVTLSTIVLISGGATILGSGSHVTHMDLIGTYESYARETGTLRLEPDGSAIFQSSRRDIVITGKWDSTEAPGFPAIYLDGIAIDPGGRARTSTAITFLYPQKEHKRLALYFEPYDQVCFLRHLP